MMWALLLLLVCNCHWTVSECPNVEFNNTEQWSSYCNSTFFIGNDGLEMECRSVLRFSSVNTSHVLQLSLTFRSLDSLGQWETHCMPLVAASVQLVHKHHVHRRSKSVETNKTSLDIFKRLQLDISVHSMNSTARLAFDSQCRRNLQQHSGPPVDFTRCVTSVNVSDATPTVEQLLAFNDVDFFTQIDAMLGSKVNFTLPKVNLAFKPEIPLPNDFFPVLSKRNTLAIHLRGTHLQTLESQYIPIPISSLLILDLGNCHLHFIDSSVFNSMPNLQFLNLSTNNLKDLPESLSNLTQIEDLDISHNPHLTFNPQLFNHMTRLRNLNASSIRFQDVSNPQTTLSKLCYLNLRNGSHRHLPKNFINRFPLLETLVLADNQYKDDDLEEFLQSSKVNNTRHFDFSGNALKNELNLNRIFRQFAHIKSINMAKNRMTSFRPMSLPHKSQISVNLQGNKIQTWHETKIVIPKGTNFSLDLSFNNITEVTAAMMTDFSALYFVNLKVNPIDENSQPFQRWLQRSSNITELRPKHVNGGNLHPIPISFVIISLLVHF